MDGITNPVRLRIVEVDDQRVGANRAGPASEIGAGFFPPTNALSASAQDFFLQKMRCRRWRRIFSSKKSVVRR